MDTQTTPSLPSSERPDQPSLTQAEVVAAATNSPALAPSFTFGGREFKLLHLEYDSYLEFMAFLQPLLEGIASKFASASGVQLPGLEMPDLSGKNATASLVKFCKTDLPAMACIVCNQEAIREKKTELRVTPEWVKQTAEDPFEIVGIVLKQINKNQMITKFASFFVQMLPLMASTMPSLKPTQPTA